MEVYIVNERSEVNGSVLNLPRVNIARSKLACEYESQSELFFSTVECRNNLFTSTSLNNIFEFYNSFKNRDQLIQWLSDRPRGVASIHEVQGKKDIIVVIPTADYFGEFARKCREEIFAGTHIVFVESGGRDDFYFNYAHNCNIGIKRAMEYNPKWIVLSGDDMYKIDNITVLRSELEKFDPAITNTVITKTALYHSIPSRMTEPNSLNHLVTKFFNDCTKKGYLKELKGKFLKGVLDPPEELSFKFRMMSWLFSRIAKESLMSEFRQKFKMNMIARPMKDDKMKFFYKKGGTEFVSLTDFQIFSTYFIRKKNNILFDETFINACEDWDISFELRSETANQEGINFRIGDFIGSTLGQKSDRYLRNFAGYIYLNNKIENKT
ncbi:MAG: hypothetical protein ACYCT2_08320 [Thermoplasmataceae archaeon]